MNEFEVQGCVRRANCSSSVGGCSSPVTTPAEEVRGGAGSAGMSLDMCALGDISDGLVAELMRIESHLPSSIVDPVISALLPHLTGAEIAALVEAAAKRQMCVAILDAARSVLSVLEEGEGDLLGTVADEVDSLGELAHFGVAGGSLQLRGSARTACHVAERFLQAVVERLYESSPCVGAGGAATPPACDTSVGGATVERSGFTPCCSCSRGRCGSAGLGMGSAETARDAVSRVVFSTVHFERSNGGDES